MNNMKKKSLALICAMITLTAMLTGCDANGTYQDLSATKNVGEKLATNQATPTDIDYSLERYNLIRRAYWVNGQREKANTLPCEVVKPLGYIILFTDNGAVVNKFVVDGKVSSLNSYLTPDSDKYATSGYSEWLPDVDGSYGENDNGIFFFDVNGHYWEWTGTYLYTDVPVEIDEPVVRYETDDTAASADVPVDTEDTIPESEETVNE